jgi:hypothetical protein
MSAFPPGPYGWNASPEHVARVDAEAARLREQTARRRAERRARPNPPKETR